METAIILTIVCLALHAWAWSALQADQQRQREEGW
jgi:hypothetical protein